MPADLDRAHVAQSTGVRAMQRIRAEVRAMRAYHVSEAQGLLKMDAMENPHRLPAVLQAALGARLGALELNRYPGAARQRVLHGLLHQYASAPADWRVLLGNGSDEIIALLTLACAAPGACVLAPAPSFVMYAISAQLHGLEFVGVDLMADFALDVPAMRAAIARHRPAIVWLAYPNNPSATLWRAADMAAVIEAAGAAGAVVVVDEAYQPFAGQSWMAHIRNAPQCGDHVLLMGTLSKFGLAGVRLGYLLGDAALIDEIDKVRPPYNISALNAEAAIFALEHTDVYARQAQDICQQRDILLRELALLPGVKKIWPSHANMILLRVADAAHTVRAMQARGVLIKNVSTMHALLNNCLRLTVGTAQENAQMLAALRQSL